MFRVGPLRNNVKPGSLLTYFHLRNNSGLGAILYPYVINKLKNINIYLITINAHYLDPQNCLHSSKSVEHLNSALKMQSNHIILVNVKNVALSELITSNILPGSVVFMAGFVSFDEIYTRKHEDRRKFICLLDMVNTFFFLGVKSKLDDCFYRGKVIKQINHFVYQIEYIDLIGTIDAFIFNLFEIPNDYMISSNVIRVDLKGFKGLNSRSLDLVGVDYINNLLTNCKPMVIELSPVEDFKNVILKLIDVESINERLCRLLNDDSTLISYIVNKPAPENVSGQEINIDNNQSKLINGDLVNIVTFIDIHNIFVRKIKDENNNFFNFIDKVNLYSSAASPIDKLPRLNDIVGIKLLSDGLFNRAKV
ncbi:Hypothetical protein CINCED_3A009836 [Cinara cedri]|uniref:Uncharacterized protein n=1 Tax=Cinara cedri TaxID=506608 RepID=A0A5E4MJ08_9HEMI|nr:Hypothetical protein CINCED_3A009836 [Cinara cedri]